MPRKNLQPKTGMKKMYAKSLGDVKGFTYVHGSGPFGLPDFAAGFKSAKDWVEKKANEVFGGTKGSAVENAKDAKARMEGRKGGGMFDEDNFDAKEKPSKQDSSGLKN